MSLHEKIHTPRWLLLPLTAAAVLIEGYHPYAEDGGVYAAGIKRLLAPWLYPQYAEFVTEHTRFSVFAPMMECLVRLSHLQLPVVLFATYVLSIWLLLYASWRVAMLSFKDVWASTGAVALVALCCGLPVAGTSLMVIDPYLTARSLSTPLMLLAVAAAMELRWFICTIALAAAACLHPLMAAYAAAFVALVICTQLKTRWRVWGPVGLGTAALALAAVLQWTAKPERDPNAIAALTRYYWFPWEWHWYELVGLAGPLVVIALVNRRPTERAAALGRAAISLGMIAAVVALGFARAHAAAYVVARLQPLRCFQMVYLVMMLLLGGWCAKRLSSHRKILAAVAFIAIAAGMFLAQRQVYPASIHLELPGREARNDWVRAFEWARANTPINVLFALDANYITTDGEDAQCFRAIAERSALPDYSKDGGEASITPQLASTWMMGSAAQTGLSVESDAERRHKILPLGVSWLVLQHSAATNLDCPYANQTVKLCRMR